VWIFGGGIYLLFHSYDERSSCDNVGPQANQYLNNIFRIGHMIFSPYVITIRLVHNVKIFLQKTIKYGRTVAKLPGFFIPRITKYCNEYCNAEEKCRSAGEKRQPVTVK